MTSPGPAGRFVRPTVVTAGSCTPSRRAHLMQPGVTVAVSVCAAIVLALFGI